MDGCFILERIEVDYIGCNNRGNTYVYVKQREEEECDANIADDACHGRGVGWGGGGGFCGSLGRLSSVVPRSRD